MNQGKAIKLTLTVKRPNGVIETVVHPSLDTITPIQFEQIKTQTAAAGRGEVLSYEIEREAAYVGKIIKNIFTTEIYLKTCAVTAAMTLNGTSK